MLRWLFILVVLTSGMAGGQPDENPEFLVRVWRSEEGLPGNVARSLGQTPDGVLWIATAEGISSFDGYEFTTLAPVGNQTGQEINPFRIYTPSDGSVWISTHDRRLFRMRGRVMEEIPIDPDTMGRGIVTRFFIHKGAPYFHYNDRTWRLVDDVPQEVAAPSDDLAAAIEQSDLRQIRRGRSGSHFEAPALLLDRKGGEWRISGGSLWYHPPAGSPTRITELGNDFVASDMLEDREGNLWLASPVRGLVRVRPRRVTILSTPEGPYDHAVNTALHSTDGVWWIAGRNGGVDRVDDQGMQHIDVIAGGAQRMVSCLYEDSGGRIWIASREGSVYQMDTAEQMAVPMFSRTPELSKVNAIAEDRQGRLWFAGNRGICRWDGESVKTFADEKGLENTRFASLAPGSGGSLLAGTTDGRILKVSSEGIEALAGSKDLSNRRVQAVVAADDGEIWAGTTGSGLFLRLQGRWHRFGSAEGIPDERITGLALTGDDEIWMGSLGGILRASRKELRSRARTGRGGIHWMRLDRSDGMPSRECVGGSNPGVAPGPGGTLWFPTLSGLAGIDPSKIPATAHPPLMRMAPVVVDGVTRPIGQHPIVAGPGRVRLEFRFAGIHLAAPEKITYQVQLVGIDEAPRRIGHKREVDYQPVPPGRYVFRASATSGDGFVSTTSVIPIEIRPHFWQTPWFVALSVGAGVLLTVAAGWLAGRRRMRRRLEELRVRNMLEAERSRISRDLHDDLGASLTALSIQSELAAENPDDQSLRPSLDRLSMRAKHVVGTLDEIVWATSPDQDSLRSLVEYLAFFAREFLKVVDVRLKADIIRNAPDIAIGPRRRHNLALATREAINNAVKHGPPETIFLRITLEDGRLLVRIRDDGPGFDASSSSSGDGLDNLRRRMADSGGDCHIDSEPGTGTTVTLSLPLPTATSP
ncbi:MAG: ATP-binding protein [Verrucomicrobiae bacterium]|nr:ATP-binding protein [Verrucomicrobiae bacterium]MCP5543945.1 ATP-binding protein [Akkermansiaceae bacterium]MCP5547577.1 ATP-binding protein [Akkermansiaceae bacterium]